MQKPTGLPPGSTIGILGGGQLGRMLAMASARLGYRTLILDPDPSAPAAQLANAHIVAAFDDEAALARLAGLCERITFEFENVPFASLAFLERLKPAFPSSRSLANTQDRLTEKRFVAGLGIATAPFFEITDEKSLAFALAATGGRGIIKTRKMGYDGKGQALVASPRQAAAAWKMLGHAPLILEGIVDFECEISVVAARAGDGGFAAYDPAINLHKGGILRQSTVPAPLDGAVLAQAIAATRAISNALSHVGVLGVEFFVTRGQQLVVNEIAPRVHNSAHWTEAVCPVCQFEQHVRAVCGLPLGTTLRTADCVMQNLIGEDMALVPQLLSEGEGMLHLYGKAQMRPGRKMGHFTRIVRKGD